MSQNLGPIICGHLKATSSTNMKSFPTSLTTASSEPSDCHNLSRTASKDHAYVVTFLLGQR
jgi:hypothetical protein